MEPSASPAKNGAGVVAQNGKQQPAAHAGHIQPSSMRGYSLPTYPFVPPPELASGKVGHHPVVVVGGGLSGLTLALDLGLRGIPVVLLDEDDNVGALGLSSRGVVYVQRTLEIFDRLGVADRVIAQGVGWSTGRVFKGEQEIYAFHSQPRGQGRIPSNTNIQQFFVEEYLVDRIAEVPAIDLRWRNRVIGIVSHADYVELTIDTPQGQYAIRADWVAACDGGSSFIRTALEVPSHVHRFDDVWCIADIRAASADAICERRLWMDAAFNDGGVVLNHQMADGVCRFNCQIAHYPDPENAGSVAEIRSRLDQALGPGAEYELVWTGVWRYKRRLTDEFVRGRVVFVGDAAHQVPPFGARGGNSGVADADNLGWKLALVVQGLAPEALVASYHAERHPAAVENVAVTSRSALFLSPDTSGRRLFRDAVLALARMLPEIRPMVNTGRLALAQHYPDSPLNLGGRWDRTGGIAEGSPPINGCIARSDGRSGHLLDLVGTGFVALWFLADDAALPPEAIELARNRYDASLRTIAVSRRPLELDQRLALELVVDETGELFATYGGEGGATYLLRPDGYVAFRDSRLVAPPACWFVGRDAGTRPPRTVAA